MKQLFLFLFVSVIFSFSISAQIIYDVSFKDIDGNNVSLNAYEGKRLLFIIVPLNQLDSAGIEQILSFQILYREKIKLVGIISIEDGYLPTNKEAIKALYQTKGIEILLTEGMHTKKEAGVSQSVLMHWLTDVEQNGQFDQDAKGIGHKFFISGVGKLVGSLGPNVPLTDPACARMVYRE